MRPRSPALPRMFSTFRELLVEGLRQDDAALDWTSLGLSRERKARAKVIAKADGVFYGNELARAAAAVSHDLGYPFESRGLVADGARVKAGTAVVEWRGDAGSILALERPYLNLAGYLSGIASRTYGLSSRVVEEWSRRKYPGAPPRVTATRKILPHYRDAAIAAVMAGGGFSHRANLAGGVLIKENHVAAAGGVGAAIRAARGIAPHGLKVEIEVRNLGELREALAESAEIIMLDNFSPSEVRSALARLPKDAAGPRIECSGGISEMTIAAYALPGVHILSVGGLTHSVTALDLSLLLA